MSLFSQGIDLVGVPLFNYASPTDEIQSIIENALSNYYDKTQTDFLLLSKVDLSAFDASWNDLPNIFVSKNGDTMTGNYNIIGDLFIDGSLNILGGITNIQTQTVEISDNLLLINSNQIGTPPLTLQSGIEVNRGDLNNYQFLFDEQSNTFKIGEINNLQPVATREETPLNNRIPYWDVNTTSFKTDRLIIIDNSNNVSIGSTPLSSYRLDIRNLTTNDSRVMINDCSECATDSNASLNIFIRENDTKEHIHLRRVFQNPNGLKVKDFGISLDEDASLTMGKYDNNGNYEELLYVSENHTIEVDGSEGGDFVIRGTPNITLSGVNSNLINNYYTKTTTDNLLDGKAPTSHTHTIANVTGLQTALDGKLNLIGGTISNRLVINGLSQTGADIGGYISHIQFGTGRVAHIGKDPSGNKLIFFTTGGGAPDPDQHIILNRDGGGIRTNIIGNLAINKTSDPTQSLDVNGNAIISGTITEGGTLLSSKYAPISHTHAITDITNLQSTLLTKKEVIFSQTFNWTGNNHYQIDIPFTSQSTQYNHFVVKVLFSGIAPNGSSRQHIENIYNLREYETSLDLTLVEQRKYSNLGQILAEWLATNAQTATLRITINPADGFQQNTLNRAYIDIYSSGGTFGTIGTPTATDLGINTTLTENTLDTNFHTSIGGDLTATGTITEGGTLLTNKYLQLSGGTLTGAIAMGSNNITGINRTSTNFITMGLASTAYNMGWTTNRWMMINHNGFSGNIGGQFPSPEGGILWNSLSSSQILEHQFYIGLTKDTASTSTTAYRMDFGSATSGGTSSGSPAPTFTSTLTLRPATQRVGIRTLSPAEALDVNGNAIIRGILNIPHETSYLQLGDAFRHKRDFTSTHISTVVNADTSLNIITFQLPILGNSHGLVVVIEIDYVVNMNRAVSWEYTEPDIYRGKLELQIRNGIMSSTYSVIYRENEKIFNKGNAWTPTLRYLNWNAYQNINEITLNATFRNSFTSSNRTRFLMNYKVYYNSSNGGDYPITYTLNPVVDLSGQTLLSSSALQYQTNDALDITGNLNVSGVSSLGLRAEILYNSGVAGDRLSIGTGTDKMAIRQNGHSMELTTTNNGNICLLPNNGNVGINNTSPIQPLQVDRITASATLNTVSIDQQHAVMVLNHQALATARKDAGIMFMGNGSDSSNISYASGMIKSGWSDAGSTAWNDGYIDFQTHGNNNTDWTTDMRIRGGNVGIGTINPTHILDIATNTVDVDTTLRLSAQNRCGILLNSDTLNASGEKGGSYVNFSQDGQLVQSTISTSQNDGVDGMGNSITGVLNNSLVIANRYDDNSGHIQFATRNQVRMTLLGDGRLSVPSSVEGLHLPVRHLRAKLNTDVYIASNTYTNILTGQLNILTGRDSIIHINAFIPYQVAGSGNDAWESLIQLSTNNSNWNNVAYGYQVWFGGTFGTGSRSGALFPLSGWFIVPATNVSTIYFKVMAKRSGSDDGANFYSVGSTSNVHMVQYIW